MRFLKIKFKIYGFTLIELLVVVSIIAILAAVGLAVFSGANSKARDSKRISDISSISNALESTYDASKGSYSDFTEQSVAEKMFASKVPQPSRSGDYSYYTNTDKSAFVLCAALEVKSDVSSQCSPLSDPALCYCIKSRQGDASNFFVLSNGSITNSASVNRYPNPNFTSPTPIPNLTYIPPASENGNNNTPTPTQAITNAPTPTPTSASTPTIASTPMPTLSNPVPLITSLNINCAAGLPYKATVTWTGTPVKPMYDFGYIIKVYVNEPSDPSDYFTTFVNNNTDHGTVEIPTGSWGNAYTYSGYKVLSLYGSNTYRVEVIDNNGSATMSFIPDQMCPQPTPDPKGYKYVFLTDQKYDGNLGGLAGADMKCQEEANAEGLSGVYKAWLSDATTEAVGRLTRSSQPYKRVDGALVANNWDDLTDGNILAPIDKNARGEGPESVLNPASTMTGTNTNGTASGRTHNCNGWSGSSSNLGLSSGSSNAIDATWSRYPYGGGCSYQRHLYCFEQ